MIHVSLKLSGVFCETVPNIASVFIGDTWGDGIILDIHDPCEEHKSLLELLVDDQPPLVL